MHRIRACVFHGLNDFIHHEIGLVHRRRANMNRLIRHTHMQRIFVRIGINRNGSNAHFPRGFYNAARDFTTIGDEEFFDFSH
jgi:hypothetical protein